MQSVRQCIPLAGICLGVLETFLFWLLQDLGATKYLMGITVTVGAVAGIPILVVLGYIFNKLGFPNTIVLGFAVYVVRMMGEWTKRLVCKRWLRERLVPVCFRDLACVETK